MSRLQGRCIPIQSMGVTVQHIRGHQVGEACINCDEFFYWGEDKPPHTLYRMRHRDSLDSLSILKKNLRGKLDWPLQPILKEQ